MSNICILLGITAGMMVLEHYWPANTLPKVRNWWGRVILTNSIQILLVYIAGISWDRWFQGASLFQLKWHWGTWGSAVINYIVVTFIYYWWHRIRHESHWFWLLCHQLHHSPRRIEVVTSFYKHPVEITLNSILSSAIAYPLMGCSPAAASLTMLLTGIAELIYHWNIRTPIWLGYIFQRPESHRIHHKYRHHTQNFSDIPLWDILFGTFFNPREPIRQCGYDPEKEDRFEDMLAFRDVHDPKVVATVPLSFLPTCIGCSKRWRCSQQRNDDPLVGEGDKD